MLNISTFFIGFCTAFFLFAGAGILFFSRGGASRYRKMLGIIMLVWAFFNLKDIVMTFPEMYNDDVLSWIMIVDGWSAMTYMVFVFETVEPGWTTRTKLLCAGAPFLAFTLARFFCIPLYVILAYSVFLWFFAWGVIVVAFVKARRYARYIRENFSDVEHISISWLVPVFVFAIISQLAWLATSLWMNVLVDILYYVSTIVLWLVVLYYSWDFQPVSVESDEREADLDPQMKVYDFAGKLEEIVEDQRLYLNQGLSLSDLVELVKSNRTYVSRYLRQVKGVSFYDYINKLRIEKAALPLMTQHPEYTLEYIAQQSGFSSISTFRRAYRKVTGTNPGDR